MSDTLRVTEDEIETEFPGGSQPTMQDADGADGDATDATDGDATDGDAADATDGDAADGTDADTTDA